MFTASASTASRRHAEARDSTRRRLRSSRSVSWTTSRSGEQVAGRVDPGLDARGEKPLLGSECRQANPARGEAHPAGEHVTDGHRPADALWRERRVDPDGHAVPRRVGDQASPTRPGTAFFGEQDPLLLENGLRRVLVLGQDQDVHRLVEPERRRLVVEGARGGAPDHATLDGAVVEGRDDLVDAQARGIAPPFGLPGTAPQVPPLRLGDRQASGVGRRLGERQKKPPVEHPEQLGPLLGLERRVSELQGGGIEPEARDGDEEVGGSAHAGISSSTNGAGDPRSVASSTSSTSPPSA